jgi:hypothetical protein
MHELSKLDVESNSRAEVLHADICHVSVGKLEDLEGRHAPARSDA